MAAIASWGLFVILSVVTFAIKRTLSSGRHNSNPTSLFWKSYHRFQIVLVAVGLAFLTTSIVSRGVATGHGPFSNMYEFSIAFSWGIVAMSLFFQWRYHELSVVTAATVIAMGLLLYANTLPSKPMPLVPALQQSYLLSAHVAAAVLAYGALTMGFVAAVIYLFQGRYAVSWMPRAETLDDMSYRAVVIGFPFMTLLIILGALWADIAWGRYWGWDPKETASLVTWLLYASYLHSRVISGWRGKRSAILLIAGFAAILFTFFGNYIFSGLHSYQ